MANPFMTNGYIQYVTTKSAFLISYVPQLVVKADSFLKKKTTETQ